MSLRAETAAQFPDGWQPMDTGTSIAGSFWGCVAKTGDGLVKVAIVLTGLSHQHTLHELQISLQVASLSP